VFLAVGFFGGGIVGAAGNGFLHPWELPVASGLILALVGLVLAEIRMRREPTFR
jgi:hypothetical protein